MYILYVQFTYCVYVYTYINIHIYYHIYIGVCACVHELRLESLKGNTFVMLTVHEQVALMTSS